MDRGLLNRIFSVSFISGVVTSNETTLAFHSLLCLKIPISQSFCVDGWFFGSPPHHLCSQIIFILHLYRREFSLSASPVKQSYWKAWVKEIVRSEQLDLYLLIATVTCPSLYKRVYYCLTVTFKNMVSKMKTWVTNWGGKKIKRKKEKTKRRNYYKWDKLKETIGGKKKVYHFIAAEHWKTVRKTIRNKFTNIPQFRVFMLLFRSLWANLHLDHNHREMNTAKTVVPIYFWMGCLLF